MKLIVISTEDYFAKETEAVSLLFVAGLQIFHLRKPNFDIEEMRKFLKKIPSKFHNRIVLHDNFSLLNEFGLKGIHLNRRNPHYISSHPSKRGEYSPLLEGLGQVSISKSCHSLEEAKNSVSQFDYVFLSPIFDSISKNGYSKAFSNEELLNAKSDGIINEKVIALGGITPENIPQVANYGFGGIAILGGIWGDFEKTGDKTKLLERFEKYKIMVND
jgi:thiamine-phosphate pyrophosphorylase